MRLGAGRPLVWVIAAVALFPVVAGISRLVGWLAGLGTAPREFLAEGLLLAGALAIVALSGWWRQTGLVGPWRSPLWALLLLGLLSLLWLFATPTLVTRAHWSTVPAALLLVALVGFNEETVFRGVVLHGLSRRGPLFAGLVSALIFGPLHLINLLSVHQPSAVALQAFNATMLGVLFAAMRLRMVSLWPLVAMHALWDLPGILLGYPRTDVPPLGVGALIVDLALVGPFALTGLVLLIHQAVRSQPRRAIVAPGILSVDGRWWWNGQRWVSAWSADGRWWWNGAAWLPVPASAPDEGSPAQ